MLGRLTDTLFHSPSRQLERERYLEEELMIMVHLSSRLRLLRLGTISRSGLTKQVVSQRPTRIRDGKSRRTVQFKRSSLLRVIQSHWLHNFVLLRQATSQVVRREELFPEEVRLLTGHLLQPKPPQPLGTVSLVGMRVRIRYQTVLPTRSAQQAIAA